MCVNKLQLTKSGNCVNVECVATSAATKVCANSCDAQVAEGLVVVGRCTELRREANVQWYWSRKVAPDRL